MIDIDITKTDALADSVQGLETAVTRLRKAMAAAFSMSAITSFTDRALDASGQLDKELLVLRLAFGKLRSAISQAVAPIGAALIPALTKAVYAVTRFVRYIGEIIATLFGLESVSRVTAESVSSLYGSLADFDQIDRLKGVDGIVQTVKEEAIVLDLWQKLIVSKIQTMLKPLKDIDFSKVIAAFEKLKEAIAPLARTLFEGLEWAWYNLLVPMAEWAVNTALPNFLEMLAEALTTLNQQIIDAKPYLQWLLQNGLLQMQQWNGEGIINYLKGLGNELMGLKDRVDTSQFAFQGITETISNFFKVWATGKLAGFGQELNLLSLALDGLGISTNALMNLFPQCSEVFSTIGSAFKTGANGIIGAVNGMLSGLTTGLNTMVSALNDMDFTIPDWIPLLGGKKFSLNLKSIIAPVIPQLAQGAVLPANKPFLAMVGDQRNGTNIEAPLSTIQEAVAVTMQSQNEAIAAGFEASIAVQKEILEAVLGIHLGDSIIGQAVTRYQQKLAVMQGG